MSPLEEREHVAPEGDSSPGAEAEARGFRGWLEKLRRHPLGRTLPLLILFGIGALLWRWDVLPQERTLRFELGAAQYRAEALEIQLTQPDGTMLEREEWRFDRGSAPDAVSTRVALRAGEYQLRTFVRDSRGLSTQTQSFKVGHDESYSLAVAPR